MPTGTKMMTNPSKDAHLNRPTKHIKSFREFIASLKDIGELLEITATVDWNLEMGAIGRLCYEKGSPVPLFTSIQGIEKGYRAATALGGVSNQQGLYLARIALSLGLPATAKGTEIVEVIAAARERDMIKPVMVKRENAPCKENIVLGNDVDLLQFPIPLIHDGDGGRYINTFGIIVAQSPDKKWTNWSIARIMLTNKNSMTGIIAPNQHIGMIFEMWKALGMDMPYALVLGGEPAIPFVGGMPLPAWVDEVDFLGAYFGEGIELTAAETVDLPVPATAEIVIEGHLSITENALEGPMGEYAGYAWGGEGTPKPVYKVTAITHRNDPILPFAVAGEPVEEDHTAWGIPNAGEIVALLRKQNIPVTSAWLTLEAANHWGVITIPNNWRQQMNNITCDELIQKIAAILFTSKAGMGTPKFIVINDDIDPTNTNEVIWGFATRCHPGSGEVVFEKENTNPLVAFLTSDEKMSFKTTKVIYNCLAPDDWGEHLPRRVNFKRSWPKEIQEKVLQNWKTYGFSK
ncbi:MAG TPA: UbiD family decarboxylase [Chitinophagaceae bacterium]|nr:UbiD family decarboxylase [Chitinophagaceae bacterium]